MSSHRQRTWKPSGESPSQNPGNSNSEGTRERRRGQRRSRHGSQMRPDGKEQESRGSVCAGVGRVAPANATAQEMRLGDQL